MIKLLTLSIFRLATIFEKYLLNTSHNSASFAIFSLPFLKIIFSPLDALFCEKKNNCLPGGSIICYLLYYLLSVKIVEVLFVRSFYEFFKIISLDFIVVSVNFILIF